MNVPILEIFSSIQGEGLFIGSRQLFLRFARCNLSCGYCDTSIDDKGASCKAEVIPGSKEFTYLPWPLEVKHIMEFICENYNLSKHHSISITGGEPLVHCLVLKEMLPEIKNIKQKVFLETNGTLYEELKQIIDYVDFVSMDIKFPGVSKIKPCWYEHEKFLEVVLNSKAYLYVKIVVSSSVNLDELKTAFKLIKKKRTDITVVLQPVILKEKTLFPTSKQLLYWQELALDYVNDVRIIPQAHKLLDLL